MDGLKGLYRAIFYDDNGRLYEEACKEFERPRTPGMRPEQSGLRAAIVVRFNRAIRAGTTRAALFAIERLGDRIDGKPVQTKVVQERRTTIFSQEPPGPAAPPQESGGESVAPAPAPVLPGVGSVAGLETA